MKVLKNFHLYHRWYLGLERYMYTHKKIINSSWSIITTHSAESWIWMLLTDSFEIVTTEKHCPWEQTPQEWGFLVLSRNFSSFTVWVGHSNNWNIISIFQLIQVSITQENRSKLYVLIGQWQRYWFPSLI